MEQWLREATSAFSVFVGLILAVLTFFGVRHRWWWSRDATATLVCPSAIREAANEVIADSPGLGVAVAWMISGGLYALFAFIFVRLMSNVRVTWNPKKSKPNRLIQPIGTSQRKPLALRYESDQDIGSAQGKKIVIHRTEFDPPKKKFRHS